MLSYRHAFHAGNHADILKHLTLFLVLNYFNQKDKPYWYIDTHAGAGVYDLGSNYAQKTTEYLGGIAKLQTQKYFPKELAAFIQMMETFQSTHGESMLYPGSPVIAATLLRNADKLRLFELHPTDSVHLIDHFRSFGRECQIQVKDGFAGLMSLLPPPTRRAVILIDPSYEEKQDYRRVIEILKEALKRFATGTFMLWYPCLSRQESQKLPAQLQKILPENYLQAELHVQAAKANEVGMTGSGMFVINPPYTLKNELVAALPFLVDTLGQDQGAKFILAGETR